MPDAAANRLTSLDRLRRAFLWRQFRFQDRQARTIGTAALKAVHIRPSAIGIDVFDTIAVRRLAGEKAADRAIAHQVAEGRGWPENPELFLDALEQAKLATNSLALDAWLDDIKSRNDFDAATARAVFDDVEHQLLRPVPGAKRALGLLREASPLTFVSDMHLSSASLHKLLEPLDLVRSDDVIVSSSDVGSSKADGTLFGARELTTRGFGGNAVFIGNDLWSDATQAKFASIATVPATAANLTRFEAAVAVSPSTHGPAIAGAARIQRLQAQAEQGDPQEIAALGGQVIGQAVLGFLLWVRSECEARNINNLVFLARDGELPLEMARAMPSDHWDGFELRYLHCGRRAWSLAAAPIVGVDRWIRVGTADDGAFLLHYATTTPFGNLLDRCGLTINEVDNSGDLQGCSASEPLTPPQAAAWAEMLRSGVLDAAILDAAEQPRRDLVDHLTQSGFPRSRTALIDVGWRGQQAWLVSALITEATGEEPLHLHFGGDSVSAELDRRVDIARFAFDDSRKPHPISSPVACLEMFLASGKPRLLGYERDASGTVRELFEERPTAVDNPSRRLLAKGAVEVAQLFPSRHELASWGVTETSPLIDQTRNLLAEFWNTPTKREAELLLGLRFEGDDSGSVVGPLISKYTMTEILGRDSQPRIWREASLRVTPWWFRGVMKIYFRIKEASTSSSRSTSLPRDLVPVDEGVGEHFGTVGK